MSTARFDTLGSCRDAGSRRSGGATRESRRRDRARGHERERRHQGRCRRAPDRDRHSQGRALGRLVRARIRARGRSVMAGRMFDVVRACNAQERKRPPPTPTTRSELRANLRRVRPPPSRPVWPISRAVRGRRIRRSTGLRSAVSLTSSPSAVGIRSMTRALVPGLDTPVWFARSVKAVEHRRELWDCGGDRWLAVTHGGLPRSRRGRGRFRRFGGVRARRRGNDRRGAVRPPPCLGALYGGTAGAMSGSALVAVWPVVHEGRHCSIACSAPAVFR